MQRLAYSTAVIPKLRAFSRVYPRVEVGVGRTARTGGQCPSAYQERGGGTATSTISSQIGIVADHKPR